MATKPSKSDTDPTETEATRLVGNGALATGDVVGVDKIRDLLFGNQMQDYDRRFSKLEERFLQRFKDIESETSRSLVSISKPVVSGITKSRMIMS